MSLNFPANFLSDEPVTEAGEQANALYAEAREAIAGIQAARDTNAAHAATYRAAQSAYDAAVQSGSASPEHEQELSATLTTAQRLVDLATQRGRIAAAEKRAEVAINEWRMFCRANRDELAEEVREECYAAAEALTEALASIEPVHARYGAIATRVHTLVEMVAPLAFNQFQSPETRERITARWIVPEAPAVPLPKAWTDPEAEVQLDDGEITPAPSVVREHVFTSSGELIS